MIERKSTPSQPFDFKAMAKYDEHGKPDIAATLGEIVKTVYNSTAPDNDKFQGTLRVQLNHDVNPLQIKIICDLHSDVDILDNLTPWLGEFTVSEFKGQKPYLTGQAGRFDRHFILPFLDDLKKFLFGQNPFTALALKTLQKEYKSETIFLDEEKQRVFIKLHGGSQQPFSDFLFSSKSLEYKMYQRRKIIEWEHKLVKAIELELIGRNAGSYSEFLNAVKKMIESKSKDFDTVYPEGEKRNLLYLAALVAQYRFLLYGEFQGIESWFAGYRKNLTEGILTLLNVVKAEQLVVHFELPWELHHLHDFASKKTPLENLFELPDMSIAQCVVGKIKTPKAELDVNDYFPDLLISLYAQQNPPKIHYVYSPMDHQRLIHLLDDAGVTVSYEMIQAVKHNRVSEQHLPAIATLHYLQASRALATTLLDIYLFRDPFNIVSAYYFGDAPLKPKSTSILFKRIEINPDLPPGDEKNLVALFEKLRDDKNTHDFCRVLQPWLTALRTYLEALGKEIPPNKTKKIAAWQEFVTYVKNIEDISSHENFDPNNVREQMINLSDVVPKFCPSILKKIIDDVIEHVTFHRYRRDLIQGAPT